MPHSIFFMKDGHAIHGSFKWEQVLANPYRMAACVSRLKMPRYFMSWCGRMAWRIQRWCLPALRRAAVARGQTSRRGNLLGHHPTPLLTIDPRDTIDRHGVGEDQVVEFVTLSQVD